MTQTLCARDLKPGMSYHEGGVLVRVLSVRHDPDTDTTALQATFRTARTMIPGSRTYDVVTEERDSFERRAALEAAALPRTIRAERALKEVLDEADSSDAGLPHRLMLTLFGALTPAEYALLRGEYHGGQDGAWWASLPEEARALAAHP